MRGLLSLLAVGHAIANPMQALQQGAGIPMPTGVVNGVDYEQMSRLAAKMPAERHIKELKMHQPAPIPLNKESNDEKDLSARDGGLKVLIAGDSMSQGQEGDYTWRYRIYQWFQSQNIAVDMVGPYKGTRQGPIAGPPMAPPLTGKEDKDDRIIADGGYAGGVTWDSDHFSIWGRACAQDVGLIENVVRNGQPDLMLVMLGFNDLGWFFSDDKGLLRNMQTFIQNARAGNPRIKIALANVPQRSSLGRDDLPQKTDAYNKALVAAIDSWTTDESPIHLVQLRENYNCELSGCPAGYDGLHPNALGEYQIARAFSLTLVKDFKIGSSALTIPGDVPSRPVPVPGNFRVATSPQGVTATWDKVYGAYGYNVQSRISGLTDWVVSNVPSNRYDTHWPLGNATYDIQIQTACGQNCAGDWTGVQSAVAHPQTAEGPKNVKISNAGAGSISVSWDASTGSYTDSIIEYSLLAWDTTQPCAWIGGYNYKSSPATINGLVDGHKYLFAMTAWNANGEGFPTLLPDRIIGKGAPGAAGAPDIQAIDGSTVHMTWDPVPGAAGYDLWIRHINNASDVSKKQNALRSNACADVGWLYPGIWNYEFCIEAYNGDDTAGKGPCKVAPTPVKGAAAAPSCPGVAANPTGCAFSNIPTFTDTPPAITSKPIHDHDPTKTRTILTPTDSKRPWQTVDCGDDAVTNVLRETGEEFWKALDVTRAWSDVTGYFIGDKDRPVFEEFTEEVAMYFNVTTNNYKCQKLQYGNDPACKVPIACKDANSPAGWAILNSFVGIEKIISNVAASVSASEASVSNQVAGIVSTFGNIPDGHVQAILDMVSLGMGLLGTPAFGDLIKGLNNFKNGLGDTVSGLKDATTNLVGQSISISKSVAAGSPDAVSESNSLKANVQGIIRIWEETLKAYTDKLFNGTPESITEIFHLIINGQTFNTAAVATIDVQKQVERAILPQLIYQAWILGKAPPFILDSGDDCKAGDPPPKKTPAPKEGYACVNGKAYYLTSTPGSYYTNPNCFQHPVTQCTPTGYKNLPGQSALDGKTYGNVTIQDFVEGSVNTWKNNGQKNGGTNTDNFAQSIVGQIYDNENGAYQIPGIFTIPVCKDSEAQGYWKKGGGTKNYPCA